MVGICMGIASLRISVPYWSPWVSTEVSPTVPIQCLRHSLVFNKCWFLPSNGLALLPKLCGPSEGVRRKPCSGWYPF